MIALLAILVLLLIAGLIIWERSTRVSPASPPPLPSRPPWTRTPAQQKARKPLQRSDHPRFQGRGVSTAGGVGARGGAGGATAQRAGPRFSLASTATPRFSGEVRRSPDAIGLACGRPIAECDRGADCLCVD